MMINPTISIITPTLNSEATIEECLNSVADQTYRNIEHLIIDGLSSDRTLGIIGNYQTYFNHIRVISEKDSGIYDAMNKGIDLATGEWIYFLGGDDVLLNVNTLSNVFVPDNYLKYDIIYGNVISTRFNGRYDYSFDRNKILDKNICHQAIFFNKDIFSKIGYFNLNYKSQADWDHNMRWILNGDIKKKYIKEDIAVYADGGFSSLTPDLIFEEDKLYNYLKYGLSSFTFNKSKKLLTQLFKKSIYQRDLKKFFNLLSLGIKLLIQELRLK